MLSLVLDPCKAQGFHQIVSVCPSVRLSVRNFLLCWLLCLFTMLLGFCKCQKLLKPDFYGKFSEPIFGQKESEWVENEVLFIF